MNKYDYIISSLDKIIPNPKCELVYKKDYELLLSTMLSAQTTDKSVNVATSPLYSKYNTLEKLNTLSIDEIESYIKTIGMYKTKAKYFKQIVSSLVNIGYVPNNRLYLESLPGVGRKTANVVLSNIYNEPLIAVDTHVERVSKRLSLVEEKDSVLVVEQKLMNLFPKTKWNRLNNQLILFGRYTCKSINPICNKCPFHEICKFYI